jgi:undecaprenyl diphosphate synthase
MALQKIERPDFGGAFPEHIAVIMDGNGRWAQKQGFRRVLGHREGVTSVREITTECARMGVKSLTLYAFSIENWKRPREEIDFLMSMLETFLVEERPTLMDNDVRLVGLGRVQDLPSGPLSKLRETEALTARNPGMLLRLALSYGARTELAEAVQRMIADAKAGRLDPASIDEESLRAYLYDPRTPDPDLLIRTAGELRLSNFLLWQASYSELYVCDVCWPEFRREHLIAALQEYARRVRKFGGLVGGEKVDGGAKRSGVRG